MDGFETADIRAMADCAGVSSQKVRPQQSSLQMREHFAGPLPETGAPDSNTAD